MITVLGASGFIGSRIFSYFKNLGFEIKGTYCRNKKKGLFFFDIANMTPQELNISKGYLIICAAAYANIDDSRRNWDLVHELNVVKTNAIIDHCFSRDVIPVYISTDNVFDGHKGSYAETDRCSPINCYGRIRLEVENHLSGSGRDYIVLRMGKVFGNDIGDNTLITSIIRDLKADKRLFCADDQVFTPLSIDDLASGIKLLMQRKERGVFHLASLTPLTRFELAKKIKQYLNIREGEIVPCKLNSLGLLEERPLLIDLDCIKFNKLVGFKQRDMLHYINFMQDAYA